MPFQIVSKFIVIYKSFFVRQKIAIGKNLK